MESSGCNKESTRGQKRAQQQLHLPLHTIATHKCLQSLGRFLLQSCILVVYEDTLHAPVRAYIHLNHIVAGELPVRMEFSGRA